MSELSLIDSQGIPQSEQELTKPIRKHVREAIEDRKRVEPTWHSNLAFAAGQFWLKWDRDQRALVMPQDLYSKELYTADVVTEYRLTALGELGSDDDRPELLLRRDDQASEDYQAQLNRAVSFGWDYEFGADDALEEARRLCLDMGTSAIRCRFDPTVGPVTADNVPHKDGKPLLDPQVALQEVAGAADAGQTLEYKPINQGKIVWEALSAFNLLIPPGIPNELSFPWEAVRRPVPLRKVQAEYGEMASALQEDTDIGSLLGLQVNTAGYAAQPGGASSGQNNRLRDHIWLTTYYERPCQEWPNGRTVTLAGASMKLLRHEEKLPYTGPDGEPRSGIAYFHWWRVTGQFWSRGLIEPMKDPQRLMNKRRTQTNEIIDRGMPFVIVEENSNALNRKGYPLELIQVKPSERQPQPVQGIGPGDWMWRDIEMLREDLEHATGIRGPRLGENPANVNTYSQLALINENEQVKRQIMLRQHKRSIARLVEDSVYDMRTYWGPSRQIGLAGDEDTVEAHVFDATKIPPFFIVKVASGSAKPRSQAAELKKIEQLWDASLAAAQPLPVRWLKDSLEAGEALEIPEAPLDAQHEKAELENHEMLQGGEPPVAYYDPIMAHLGSHRAAQVHAELSGDMASWDRIEQHIQAHIQVEQENAQQVAAVHAGEPIPQPAAPGPAPGIPAGNGVSPVG